MSVPRERSRLAGAYCMCSFRIEYFNSVTYCFVVFINYPLICCALPFLILLISPHSCLALLHLAYVSVRPNSAFNLAPIVFPNEFPYCFHPG